MRHAIVLVEQPLEFCIELALVFDFPTIYNDYCNGSHIKNGPK